MTLTYHVGRPNLGNRERLMARIEGMLDRNWLTNDGPLVREFERSVAEVAGVSQCVAMCNATVALEIAIRALGLTGEVIVPSFTFVATAHALQWQKITPVFCDIEPTKHHLDPNRIEELITPRTTGIIGVHLWGRPCDTQTIESVASRRGLQVLYDAAHTFGCTQRGRRVGGFGAAEVFSFHATKFVNAFEGGAVTTNDEALAEKMRLMRNFGFAGYDNVIYIGTNGKMPEICAAMGLTSLESMDEFIDRNRANHESYAEHLAGIPGLRLLPYDATEQPNYQYVVIEVDPTELGLTRDEVVAVLHERNILARRYFYPGCHAMEPYRSFFPHARLLLPVTERVASRVAVLPTGTGIGPDAVRRICEIMASASERALECRRSIGTNSVHRLSGLKSIPSPRLVP